MINPNILTTAVELLGGPLVAAVGTGEVEFGGRGDTLTSCGNTAGSRPASVDLKS